MFIFFFIMWILVFGFPTWMTKSIKVAAITLGICLVISTIIYAHDDHTDPVLKDTWGKTAPLTFSYHIASNDDSGATHVYFSIANPTSLQYQNVKIACSYDYVGDDGNWYHQDSKYIPTGAYVVQPNSTYMSAGFDETDRDLLITHDEVKNLSCSIMHGFLSSPSSFSVLY